ncbi:MAG: sensor histidine kinase, partial [Terriglobales bacterium]
AQAHTQVLLHDQEQKREFVRRINHDLRAPVSVLSWTISRLRKDGLQSKGAPEKVDRLANTADRLFALINELVKSYDTQSVAAGSSESSTNAIAAEPAATEECDLVKALTDSYSMQTSLAEQRSSTLELDIELPAGQSAIVAGNQLKLARCVDNLIRNALLHNEPGIKVSLSLRESENVFLITVKDNGKGISAEHLDHIFDQGYRIEERNDEHEHEGLGLNIVKSFVESMHGKITVASEAGNGASFTIHLPALSRTTPEVDVPATPSTETERAAKEQAPGRTR